MAVVRVSRKMADDAVSKTDWQAIDALSDEAIAAAVAQDPDAAPIRNGAQTAAAIVRTTRRRLGLSQAAFAAKYYIPIGTLRDWEQNRRQPDAPSLAYLRVIAREPHLVARALSDVGDPDERVAAVLP